MQQTLLSTKLLAPEPAADVIPRPQLVRLLDQAPVHGRLTVVVAPAGYGKTTTVASWLRQLRLLQPAICVGWYAVDESDNDLLVFLRYLTGAVRTALPGALPRSMALLVQGIQVNVETVAVEVLREVAALEGRLILVLDDYHFITTLEIHDFMRSLLDCKPADLHLILTTRHDPPLRLAGLRAREELNEIRVGQLAFSAEETLAFLRVTVSPSLPEEQARVLHEGTEGWAAGLRLATVSIRDPAARDQFIANFGERGQRYVADYLMDEVLSTVSTETFRFLLTTSLLARLNPDLASAVLETNAKVCRRLLRELEGQNLFLFPLEGDGDWHRYHQQFQIMLQQRLRSRTQPAEIAAIHGRAGDWLAARGWLEDAAGHYTAGGFRDRLAALVEANATSLENGDRWDRLSRLLGAIPDETLHSRPRLILARIWCHLVWLDWGPVPGLLERVETLLLGAGLGEVDEPALWGEIHTLRGSSVLADVLPQERLAHLEKALKLVPREHSWVRAYAFAMLAYVMAEPGQTEACATLIREELQAPGVGGAYEVRLLQALGLIYFRYGSLVEYQAICERYLRLAEAIGMYSSVAYGHLASACLATTAANRRQPSPISRRSLNIRDLSAAR